MESRSLPKTVYFIIAYILVILGSTINWGLYASPLQLALLVMGFFVFLIPLFKKTTVDDSVLKLNQILALIFFVSLVLFFVYASISHTGKANAQVIFFFRLIALILGSAYLFLRIKAAPGWWGRIVSHFNRNKFTYLVVLAVVMQLLVLVYSPNPRIDVFWALDGGAQALLEGRNPYTESWIFQNYLGQEEVVHATVGYLPLTILAVTFSKLFFSDIRVILILAALGIAWIIYYLAKVRFEFSKEIAELLALIFLYSPLSLLILENAWVDLLGLLLLYLFTFFLVVRREKFSALMLGLLFTVKQPLFVLVLFFPKLKTLQFKHFLLAGLVLFIIMLPFFLWNQAAFLNDVFFDHLQRLEDPFWAVSLSNVLSLDNWGHSSLFAGAALLVLYVLLLAKAERNLFGFLYAATIFLFAIFLYKRGFANYYHFISGCIILLIVLELGRIKNKLPL